MKSVDSTDSVESMRDEELALTAEQLRAREAFDSLLAVVGTPAATDDRSASGAAVATVATGSDAATGSGAEASYPARATGDTAAPTADPVPRVHNFDFSERAHRVAPHTNGLDWAALGLAVIAPPIGLLASIAVRVRSYRKHGWTSRVAQIATVVSVFTTIAAAVLVTITVNVAAADAAKAQRFADSAPLCAQLATTPGVLGQPAYGWPMERTAIAETLVAMEGYQARWAALADVAPSFETSAVRSVADAATTLINEVKSSQSINRAGNLDRMTMITDQTGLPQWYATYCN